jgi:glycosidase
MVDRFANGDAKNDGPLVNAGNPRMYHGGDLEGIRQRLPYLKHLGVTTLWLTPIYDNSDKPHESARGVYTSYHGYGAVNMYAVEEYFGKLDTLRRLVDDAHAAGLKIILDQIANHVGAEHPWAVNPPTPTWLHGTVEEHPPFSSQMWSLLDPRASPTLRQRTLQGWFAGRLPDLNQDDPEVARYLIQNTLWWIGVTGIDGIRQDTVPYVPASFWRRWNAAIQREYPRFRVVGEVYDRDPRLLAHFARTGFGSLFDFPLYFAIRTAFAGGRARFDELPHTLSQDDAYSNPASLVTFLGSHDVRRLRTEAGNAQSLKDAFTFLLTTRGTPLIYYGDEIAMQGGGDPDNRGMFPTAAFESAGRAGEQAEVFEHVRRLLALRAKLEALRRGELIHLAAGPDHYAYARRIAGATVIVTFGRAIDVDVGFLALPTATASDVLGSSSTALAQKGTLALTGPGVYVFSR